MDEGGSALSGAISIDDARQVAKLARLGLAEAELAALTDDLNKILERVARLQAVDVEGVEPLAHVGDLHSVLREDEPRPGLTRAEALACAPDAASGCFRVPTVIRREEGGPA